MNTLTKYQLQCIFDTLEGVRRCFDAMERNGGSEGMANLGRDYARKVRDALLGASLTDIAIEPPVVVRKIAITVPASQSEVVL